MIHNDELFDAIADLQRRQLLVGLLRDDPQPIPKLSTVSQEMLQTHGNLLGEFLSGSLEIANADKADIRTYHVHLPKLVQYGYIEWIRDASVVTKGPQFDDLRPLLEVVDNQREERPTKDAPMDIRI